jgi:glycosyltransferase involved in cell wall biosynthesis
MRIAIFDYLVTPGNPIGSCHRKLVGSLCREHSFTVFAVRFDNPDPARIRWVRIPAPRRPLALLFTAFHVLAPFYYWFYRLFRRARFDLVQGVESNFALADVAYSHFCHEVYLADHWKPVGSRLRTIFSWLDHALHAIMEGPVYRRSRSIVVPSQGLARELHRAHPETDGKVHVLANPVDVVRMRRPADFDAGGFRRRFGLNNRHKVMVFVALGHFERKGLPLLLQAIQLLRRPELKLLVVGGAPGLVSYYHSKAYAMGIAPHVVFAGMQKDVRPFLWAADAFVFPSEYEVSSLAILEAAAAGLPILVPKLNGAEEFLRDGENGFLIERTPDNIADAIRRLLELAAERRDALGRQAQNDVQRYSVERFSEAWRRFYDEQTVG